MIRSRSSDSRGDSAPDAHERRALVAPSEAHVRPRSAVAHPPGPPPSAAHCRVVDTSQSPIATSSSRLSMVARWTNVSALASTRIPSTSSTVDLSRWPTTPGRRIREPPVGDAEVHPGLLVEPRRQWHAMDACGGRVAEEVVDPREHADRLEQGSRLVADGRGDADAASWPRERHRAQLGGGVSPLEALPDREAVWTPHAEMMPGVPRAGGRGLSRGETSYEGMIATGQAGDRPVACGRDRSRARRTARVRRRLTHARRRPLTRGSDRSRRRPLTRGRRPLTRGRRPLTRGSDRSRSGSDHSRAATSWGCRAAR